MPPAAKQSRVGGQFIPIVLKSNNSDVDPFPYYNVTVRFADRVVSLYEPEIVTVVEPIIRDVCTVKVALVAPAGTVTLVGRWPIVAPGA